MVINQRGFSHLEVLLSLTVFLIASTFVLNLQGKLFTFAYHNDLREEMVLETGNIIEELKHGEKIADISSEFDFQYSVIKETKVYRYIKLDLQHPKVDRFDMSTEHYLLKQEVKAYVLPPQ